MPDKEDFDEALQGIEAAIRRIDSVPDPATRALTKELMQSVMDLHAAGLRRILELIFEKGEAGAKMIDTLGDDRLAGGLLLLYGLHPLDLETRVRRALEKASMTAHAHGGRIELAGIANGIVELRLHGVLKQDGAAAIKAAIDTEIYSAAPDVVAIRGLETVAGPDFFPLARLAASGSNQATPGLALPTTS